MSLSVGAVTAIVVGGVALIGVAGKVVDELTEDDVAR
jgi:hypothetical protein